MNFYEDLGVTQNATPEELKAAYRKRAHETHPDKGGDAEEFKRICHAFKMLSDPSYRYRDQEQNKPIQLQVQISLEQAVFGCTITNLVRKIVVQATQEGKQELTGKVNYDVVEIIDKLPPRLLHFPYVVIHPDTKFSGMVRTVEIHYLLMDHPNFKLDGNGRLHTIKEVDLFTLLKGGKVEVETLFGLRTLRIPAGTEQHEILTIRNHGDLGNLFVEIMVKYPRRQDLQKNEKWKEVVEIDWEREQQLDLEEQKELDQTFMRLG